MLCAQGAQPGSSCWLSWLEHLQLLVVNAGWEEEGFGLLACMSETSGGMFVNLSHFYIHRFVRAILSGNLISVH